MDYLVILEVYLLEIGSTPSLSKSIDFINNCITGNAADFGDLTVQHYGVASSSVKAIVCWWI